MPRTTDLEPATVELIDDLLTEWQATDRARANARYTVVAFARWLTARGTEPMAASSSDCLEWLRQRGTEVAASTVAKNWSDLRAFYRTAEGDIADPLDGRRSPMARVRMPRYPKFARTHAATVAEVDAMVATFDRRAGIGLRNASMISLMFRSGLRVSETARAAIAEVDLDARQIHLPMTKNLIPRSPALHPETLTLLRRYLRRRGDHPGPLFVSAGPRARTEAMTTAGVTNVVKRAAAQAGVDVSPHALRRGFAVEYLRHGGDVATLMVIGGWESETMVVRYMGDQRAATAQAVYDTVATRQVAARRRLHAVG